MTPEDSSVSAPPSPWVQIGVWGDSIVHGGGDIDLGGWVNRLRLYLNRRGLGDHVFNLGLGGNNSQEVADRIAPELAARCVHIDHVLVSVGANDIGYEIKLTTPEQFRANLLSIVRTIRGFGKTVRLMTMTRSLKQPGRWVTFNDVIIQVAADEGCGLLDLRQIPDPEDLPDQVHPTPAGHEKIFQAVRLLLMEEGIIPPEP